MANIEKKYKVMIVDDDADSIEIIQKSLTAFPDTEVVFTITDAVEASQLILTAQPELLFIDVEMPCKSGLEIISELEGRITWGMQVVFYTAYDKYLLEALRSSAFDFLLKPYTEQEFTTIMSRFFKKASEKTFTHTFDKQLKQLLPPNNRFVVTTPTGAQLIKSSDIVFFEYESFKKIWNIFTVDEKQYTLKRGTNAENILGYSPTSVQISQYLIINIDYLSSIEDNHCIMFPPYQNLPLKISRKYYKSFINKFENI